jgi:hypothetical protein
MKKRAYERIPANIKVKFHCNETDYFGRVTNLSEKGMFITTNDVCFPFDSMFEIVFPLKQKAIHIPVKVSRMTKTGDCYNGLGVEILEPARKYLKFIEDLRSS